MEENTLENLKIIEDMDKELLHIQMEQVYKGIWKKGKLIKRQ